MGKKENIKLFLIEKGRINENEEKIYKDELKIELRNIKKVKWKDNQKYTIKLIKVKSEKTRIK